MDRFLPAQESLNWLRVEQAFGGNQNLEHDVMPIRMPTHHIEYCFSPADRTALQNFLMKTDPGEHERTGHGCSKILRREILYPVSPHREGGAFFYRDLVKEVNHSES
jgi:hypothetical protein